MAGMVPQPLADLLDALVILLAELLKINGFKMVTGFDGMQVILPGTGEELVQVVVQVAVDQHFPFPEFEPDTVAVAAAVQIEVGVGEDLIDRHDVTAVRAELEFLHVPGWVDLDRAFLFGQGAPQGPPPGHIGIGWKIHPLAVRALPGRQALQQNDRTQLIFLADRTLHLDLR